MAKGPFWVHLNEAHIAAHFVSVSSSSSCVPLPRVAFLAGTLRELAPLFHGGINRGREQKPKGRRRRCRRRRLHGGPLSLPSFRRARPSQALLQEGTCSLSRRPPNHLPLTDHNSFRCSFRLWVSKFLFIFRVFRFSGVLSASHPGAESPILTDSFFALPLDKAKSIV